jgi:hypothetical protein
MKDQGLEFPADDVSLGDEFLKHLSSAIFTLSQNLWKSLNDPHNRRGLALEPEFGVFWEERFSDIKQDNICKTCGSEWGR